MLDTVNTTPAFDLNRPETLVLDLAEATPKTILALVEAVNADIKANPDFGLLPVVTGWNEITRLLE